MELILCLVVFILRNHLSVEELHSYADETSNDEGVEDLVIDRVSQPPIYPFLELLLTQTNFRKDNLTICVGPKHQSRVREDLLGRRNLFRFPGHEGSIWRVKTTDPPTPSLGRLKSPTTKSLLVQHPPRRYEGSEKLIITVVTGLHL